MVLQVRVDGSLLHLAAVPVAARVGGAGQAQFRAVGITGQADKHGTATVVDTADSQADGGGGREVVVERCIQGAALAPHLVNKRVAVVFIDDGAAAQRAFRVQGAA